MDPERICLSNLRVFKLRITLKKFFTFRKVNFSLLSYFLLDDIKINPRSIKSNSRGNFNFLGLKIFLILLGEIFIFLGEIFIFLGLKF